MAEETTTTTTQQPAQAAQTGTTQTQQTQQTSQTAQEPTAEAEKKFTQDDLDDAVEKRLERARRKWEREQQKPPAAQQAAAQPAAGAAPSTAPQTPAAPAVSNETDKQLAKANARQVRLAARLTAVELGVPATRAEYAARMADLSKVDVDEVDGPDTDAIKKAVAQVLKDIPELKGPAQSAESGQKPGIKVGADNSTQKPAAAAQAPAASQATRVKPWNKFRTRNF